MGSSNPNDSIIETIEGFSLVITALIFSVFLLITALKGFAISTCSYNQSL